MTPSLWFVVPAAGRLAIAQVCLRQLRRTCDQLTHRGIKASAIVIADDDNLDIAQANGFATYECDNTQLGRKLNHGYQCAGQEGVEYMVPFGSDDWIDPDWILLPDEGETMATRYSTVVNPTCTRMAALTIKFGDGVRIYHRNTLEKVGFRPVPEDRKRAMDASTHAGIEKTGARLMFHDTHPLCIVDFKSAENLNDYDGCVTTYRGAKTETADVWGELAKVYPAEAIAEMRALHR